MKKIITLNGIAVLIVLLTFQVSCTKDETGTTATEQTKTQKEKLTRAWLATEQATDNNYDGTLEGNEIRPVPDGEEYTYTFENDGTLSLHSVISGAYPVDNVMYYTWELRNNDETIFIRGQKTEDTLTATITKLTETELEYNSTTILAGKTIIGWTKLKKK